MLPGRISGNNPITFEDHLAGATAGAIFGAIIGFIYPTLKKIFPKL